MEESFDYSINDATRFVDELKDRVHELYDENKRLKELCDRYEEEHKTTFEEWKKTINIINELEKELFIKKEFYERELTIRPKNDSEYNTQYADSCALAQICVIYDKLQELKGSDKK